MSRAFFVLAWLFVSMQVSGQFVFSGKVTDNEGVPLVGANVAFQGLYLGTVTGADGSFSFNNLDNGTYHIRISYIGYAKKDTTLTFNHDIHLKIRLQPSPVMGEEVIVRAVRAGEKDPVASSMVTHQEIRNQDYGRDLPYLLSFTPSVVTTSDAGQGVGYTGFRIRGTDLNRINVTINGIPLNDPESHGVFFVDIPDFAGSVENVQVQRGVGTSTNGAAAFGGSMNFQTTALNKTPYGEVDSWYGSYNTLKNSVSVGTGMLDDKFSFDLRLSDVSSDGYIDRASSALKSFFLSSAYYTSKSLLKLDIFSGKEKTYQAWDGVPGYLLDSLRTFNGIGMYTTDDGQVKYYDNETDNYQQDHYQLHYSYDLSRSLTLNAGLHYTKGFGYYEQYKEDQDLSDYLLKPVIIGNDTVSSTDLIRRKWLDNDFYGMILSLNFNRNRVSAYLGGGLNKYVGGHYGTIIWARYAGSSEIRHHWYDNTGKKFDYNVYTKVNYELTNKINLYGDLQVRGIDYSIRGIDDDLRSLTQSHSYLFFNPKAGVNFSPDARQRAYLSFAIASREPNRDNFIDADPGHPVPGPERLNDIEAGYLYQSSRLRAGVNMYYMNYHNQLVLTGEINDVGAAVMTNVEKSYRAGIELMAGLKAGEHLSWDANLTLSRNKIPDMVSYVDNWDYWNDPDNELYQYVEDLGTTDIAFSPSVIASSIIGYSLLKNLSVQLQSKYVSRQYIDNTSSMSRSLDPYFVNDLRFSYALKTRWTKQLSFHFMVANLFNERYETNAWIYRYVSNGEEAFMDGYFPQAGRHFTGGIRVRF
ncbi:MAG TPA: TonB-dependent receptor [Bacteroidales bacterium]|nr:TonB-dependent receptor [Bacteroidales bacterium]